MTDTISCPNCSASVPSAAAFCTTCGQPLAAPAAVDAPTQVAAEAPEAPTAAAPPPPPADPTRVDTPGLHDATQVAAPPPPSPFAAPIAPPPTAGPWGPSAPVAPAPPAPPGPPVHPGPPGASPWNQPVAAPPAGWQQPAASPFDPAGGPPLGGQSWAAPGAPGAAPWPGAAGAPAAAPVAKGTKSPIGGIVALIGAALTIGGVFSGWVKLDSTGTVTAWSLTAGDGLLKSNDPYAIVALAAVAVIGAFLLFAGVARTLVRIVVILVGLGIVAVTALNWAAIASFVTDNFPSSFQASTAVGFYLAIAGGILVAIAGLFPAKK